MTDVEAFPSNLHITPHFRLKLTSAYQYCRSVLTYVNYYHRRSVLLTYTYSRTPQNLPIIVSQADQLLLLILQQLFGECDSAIIGSGQSEGSKSRKFPIFVDHLKWRAFLDRQIAADLESKEF
jgi:hypothetical protein